MSTEAPAYSQLYINAWTILSVTLGLVFLVTFIFGAHLLHAFGELWSLIRWICTPII